MGEGLAVDAAWLFAGLLTLIVVAATALAARRYWLERGGGTVECGLRHPSARGAWRLGVVCYQRDELCWHGALGVALRPEHTFPRRSVEVISRRPTAPSEAQVLGQDWIVIEAKVGSLGELVEFAMSDEALTGLLAWLEAAPPGSHLDNLGPLPAAILPLGGRPRSGYGNRATVSSEVTASTGSGASGARPAIRSAARSASAITGALVFPRGRVGITDASTTRSPSTPRTRNWGSTTDAWRAACSGESPPMAHVPVGW